MINIMSRKSCRLYSILCNYCTFIKYCVVGCLATGIDFSIFFIGFSIFHLGSVGSKLIAFSSAAIVSYVFNRTWTFGSQSCKIRYQFPKFLAVSLTGAGLSSVIIFTQIDMLGIHPLIANGITSGLVLTWNFLANKFWAFRSVWKHECREEMPLRDVSLVIPAYNEEQRLGRTLEQNITYFLGLGLSWEMIIVDDGSHDRTINIAREYVDKYMNHVRLLRLPRNRGKGAAVQMGVINAIGRYIIVADADNATPIEEIANFMAEATSDEILIGSRYIQSAKITRKQSRGRVFIGRLGNYLIRLFLIDGIADTQCGFKLFPAIIARELFSRQRINGWGFDMEILSIAQSRGIPIREKGVTWQDVPGSRLRPLRDALKTFCELMIIKINMWSGIYA